MLLLGGRKLDDGLQLEIQDVPIVPLHVVLVLLLGVPSAHHE